LRVVRGVVTRSRSEAVKISADATRSVRVIVRWAVVACGLMVLAACQSDEEKAAQYLEEAQAFVAADDLTRARVSYLNLLRLTPNDIPSRFALAGIEDSLGNIQAAYAQWLRIVEQDPRHVPSQLRLTSLALERREWEKARSHLVPIAEVAGDNIAVKTGLAIVDYADAASSTDPAAVRRAHAALLELLPQAPANLMLHRAIIDGFRRMGQPEAALSAADTALALAPEDVEFAQVRLVLLQDLGRDEDALEQLKQIVATHPDLAVFRRMLVDWHIELGELDAAEALLRDVPDPSDVSNQLALVRFIADYRGQDEALATLERLVAAHGRPTVLRLLRAAMAFDDADVEGALQEMHDAIAAADAAGENTTAALYLLAQMLDASGDRSAAETALNRLLEKDPRNVPGAQLQAVWLLERGRPDLATRLLRTAEAVEPENSVTLMLLSRAYAANGETVLETQTLARAVAESEYDAVPALDYAVALAAEDRISLAVEVLDRAIERFPDNATLLKRQGELLLALGQSDRVSTLENRLRVIGTVQARILADDLQFRRLISEGDADTALSRVALRAEAGNVTQTGLAVLARTALAAGLPDISQALLDIGEAHLPQSAELQAVSAELAIAQGDLEGAASVYAALTESAPESETLWLDFIALRKRQGDPQQLIDTVARAAAALPASPTLEWERATALQATDDIEGAIRSYQALLAAHPDSAPVRNNLAALLLQGDPDELQIERAAELVEPLVGSPIPQFLDTVGLVRFRQGNLEAAADALVPAAAALTDDAQVQWHAAEALRALGRNTEARPLYERVTALNDAALAERARAALTNLDSSDKEG
jgi:tetratricopeptide (TPR) repeat protein